MIRRLFAVAAVPLLIVAALAGYTAAVVLFGVALIAATWNPPQPRPPRARRLGPLR